LTAVRSCFPHSWQWLRRWPLLQPTPF
jgi:hypothetical protein